MGTAGAGEQAASLGPLHEACLAAAAAGLLRTGRLRQPSCSRSAAPAHLGLSTGLHRLARCTCETAHCRCSCWCACQALPQHSAPCLCVAAASSKCVTPGRCSLPVIGRRPCRPCHHLCEVSQPAEDGLRAGVGDERSHSHGVWLDEAAAQAAGNGSQNVQGCHAVWTVQLLQKRLPAALSVHDFTKDIQRAKQTYAVLLAGQHEVMAPPDVGTGCQMVCCTCTYRLAGSEPMRSSSTCWPLTGQLRLGVTRHAAHHEGRGLTGM